MFVEETIFKAKIYTYVYQKQPPRGVLNKKCSKNMQQIYRRTPRPKCDFHKSHFDMGALL